MKVHLAHVFCVLDSDFAGAPRIVWMVSMAGRLQTKAFWTVLTPHVADEVNLLRPVLSEHGVNLEQVRRNGEGKVVVTV